MKPRLIAALLLASATLTGCSALDYKSGTSVSNAQLAAFKPGNTTQDDVVKAIGNPPKKDEVNGKEIWSYPYTKIAAIPFMPNASETTVFEWSKKGKLLNAYKSGGTAGGSDNPLLSAAGQ
ncbi:hypothetical protein [Pantoea sp. JK]|uniref:hypothetical protein n=1 Tax=Pantoea sp. JK TaxID=2871703 RepID=UPI002237C159|nr:hypothetical protein [Pantoea sp. JK]MCW6034539.1 hypothetical protein [Pantoea sp. JK]